jgi:hypothetical protein
MTAVKSADHPELKGTSAIPRKQPEMGGDYPPPKKVRRVPGQALEPLEDDGHFVDVPTSTFIARTARFRWNGFMDGNFFVGGGRVNADSQVTASITELQTFTNLPMIGSAPMLVYNIAPNNDGRIYFKLNIDWFEPLTVQVNFIICN